MSRNSDQRSTFIAEYAAKRQSQMERAKQLREQRSGPSAISSYDQPSPAAAPSRGSPLVAQPSFDDLPAKPQTLRSSVDINQFVAPTVSPQFSNSRRAPIEYPPPITTQYQASSAPTSNYNSLPRPSAVEVTEQSFREATQRGIITSDQARQLWAVLSDQAMIVSSQNNHRQPPSAAGVRPPLSSGTGGNGYNGTYDPRQFAAPGDGYGQQQPPPSATYKGSFAHNLALGGEPTASEGQYTSLQALAAQGNGPTKLAKGTAIRASPLTSHSSLPEWNTDTTYQTEDYDSHVNVAPAPRGGKAPPSRNQRPEWNLDTETAPEAVSTPVSQQRGAQPAPKGAAVGRRPQRQEEEVAPLEQMVPPKAARQPPAKQATPASRGAPQSRGYNSRQPAPPPEPEVVEQDPEEIEEFLRLKEEAKRQFEDALEDANNREPLIECNVCGRRFRESVIDRHEGACKTVNKKRKVFDSKNNRLSGIDGIEEVLSQQPRGNRRGGAPGGKASAAAPPSRGGQQQPEMPANKLPKWKLQHQQFQLALQAIKQASTPAGLAAPPPTMPDSLDDRIPCPHCSRKFAPDTAARHIPHCAHTINKPKPVVRPGGRR